MFHGASPFPRLGRIDGSNSSQKGDFDNLIFRVGPGQSRNATDCTPATSKRLRQRMFFTCNPTLCAQRKNKSALVLPLNAQKAARSGVPFAKDGAPTAW